MPLKTLIEELDALSTNDLYKMWQMALDGEMLLSLKHGRRAVEATIEALSKEYRARLV